MNSKELPPGLHYSAKGKLIIRPEYRTQIEDFTHLLPGDLLYYVTKERICLVSERDEDIVVGWHISQDGNSGGWGHEFTGWDLIKDPVERIAPSLTLTILKTLADNGVEQKFLHTGNKDVWAVD